MLIAALFILIISPSWKSFTYLSTLDLIKKILLSELTIGQDGGIHEGYSGIPGQCWCVYVCVCVCVCV